jgi:hypothetical protein
MKKLILVVLIGLLVSTAAFADHEGFGIGPVFGFGWFDGNIGWGALSLKIPNIPIFWAFSIPYVGRGGFNFGVSGDFYFIDKNLVSNTMTNEDGDYNFKLDWYFGLGFFVNMFFGNRYWYDPYWDNNVLHPGGWETRGSVDFGLRVPIGLSWHIIKQIELFLGLVPGVGFWIGPSWDNKLHEYYTDFNVYPYIGGEIGVRFWFN